MDSSFFQIIDLSVPLEHNAASEPMPAKIHYVDARRRRASSRCSSSSASRPRIWSSPSGLGWAIEEIKAITHTGTHVDAPYHYGADVRRQAGPHASTRCRSSGASRRASCSTCGTRPPGEFITVADLRGGTATHRLPLQPLDIVLLQTGADKRLGSPDYFAPAGPGPRGRRCGWSSRA